MSPCSRGGAGYDPAVSADGGPATDVLGPVEIRGEGLGKAFDGHVVLRRVSLEVRRGEIVALVGASGSGKTVLLHLLTGLHPPTEGRVLVAHHGRRGAPLVDLETLDEEERDAVRLSWAVVFQKNALFSATVYENCALWLREHTQLPARAIRERVCESLQAVSLDVDTVIGKDRDELSGGMAKRVAVARAIAQDPLLVFYDEPTTGLDPVTSAHLHELIWNTHFRPRRDGVRRTTVLVTHDKDLLRRLHPRVVMLHGGGVCFDGTYAEFTASTLGPAREYLLAMPVLHAGPSRDAEGTP